MEQKIAIIGVIVENTDSVDALNALLHTYSESIIGRMGIPHRKRGINIISVALDAPSEVIDTLSAKISELDGVSVSAAYSAV